MLLFWLSVLKQKPLARNKSFTDTDPALVGVSKAFVHYHLIILGLIVMSRERGTLPTVQTLY